MDRLFPRNLIVILLVTSISMPGGSMSIAAQPMVEARADQLVWSVSEPVDSARITLTGPGDFFLQQHFEFDGPWSLPLWSLDPPMIDGAYRWRLELLFPNPSTKPRKRDSQVVTGILQMRDGHWISPPRKTLQEPRELDIAEAEPGIHVAESGRVGLGTSTPAAQAHIVDGEAPTLRLEQDITADRPPQTWDIEADDQAFSIHDQTRGTEPLRIEAGAPDSSLFIAADGRVGLAGPPTNPGAQLQVPGAVAVTDQLQVLSSQDSDVWLINNRGHQLEFSKVGTEAVEMILSDNGDLKLEGSLEVAGVFQESIDLGEHSLVETQGTLKMTRFGVSPFKLRPGAPENSLVIDHQGRVGVGHDLPNVPFHVKANQNLQMRLTSDSFRTGFELENTKATLPNMAWPGDGQTWRIDVNGHSDLTFIDANRGIRALQLTAANGDVIISGDLIFRTENRSNSAPWRSLEPGGHPMPLEELESFIKHYQKLPNLPSTQEIRNQGLNATAVQLELMAKVGELTLYILDQEARMDQLERELSALGAQRSLDPSP